MTHILAKSEPTLVERVLLFITIGVMFVMLVVLISKSVRLHSTVLENQKDIQQLKVAINADAIDEVLNKDE